MPRQAFEKNLQEVQMQVLQMGKLVDEALAQAVSALKSQNLQLAQEIISQDEAIDELQIQIEDRCLMLIALQQPIAKDLRLLSTALKITIDLERMGDHAKNIAEVTLEIGKSPLVKPLVDIPQMGDKVRKMLNNSLRAYVETDVELAEEVCFADEEVDELCENALHDLLEIMLEDSTTINQVSQLLYIARCLERAGDHATNIAEGVVYLVTGQRFKGN